MQNFMTIGQGLEVAQKCKFLEYVMCEIYGKFCQMQRMVPDITILYLVQ